MSEKFDIGQIADLGRLNLKADERAHLSKDLEKILAYVNQLQELDTDQVEPTSHPLAIENVFRDDSVKPCDLGAMVLKHAPKSEGKYFKVPKVIES